MKILIPCCLAAVGLLAPPLACAQQARPAAPATPAAAAPPASAASGAGGVAARIEVVNAVNAAVELSRAKKSAEALSRIEKTLADLPMPTPTELAVLQRPQGLLLMQLERPADAIKPLEAAHNARVFPPAELRELAGSLTRAHYLTKSYAGVLEWADKAAVDGKRPADLEPLVIRARLFTKDYPGVIRDLEAQEKAAGGKLTEDEIRILVLAYRESGNDAASGRALERLMREFPKADYWPELLSRAERQPGWQQRYDIHLLRLRREVDLMDDPSDYVILADLAGRAGLPAEGQAVIEAGYAKGMLGKGSGAAEHQKLRASLAKQVNDDRASLTASAARAPVVTDARSAAAAMTTGSALVSVGQTDRGLEYMKAALAGPLADPALGRLEYAAALRRAGKNAEAVEVLKPLSEHATFGMLARLWTIALTAPKKG